MSNKWVTFSEHLLKEEQKFPKATGNLSLLLTEIAESSKIIASHVKNSGLVNIEGLSGKKNIYLEEVRKLDEFANNLLVDRLSKTGQVFALASEELEEPYMIKNSKAEYSVFFDPLDGSSNVDNNNSLGTIFSIYKKSEKFLQSGKNQVAAGYIFYGSSVILVYTTGRTVNGFTLDASEGSFLLSHPDMKIPEKGNAYGINEGNWNLFEDPVRKFLSFLKEKDPYRLRYAACMVADIHRFLIDGGIFIYPKDSSAPDGKLRLMFEVNPMSFVIKHAGGMAVTTTDDPLEIAPSKLHQRTPVAIGSPDEVRRYLKFHKQ